MGMSLKVQIVNYLSIEKAEKLESSMDAQNNWFMHTIKVLVLQKITVVVFKYFLKPENVSEKWHWMWDIFQSCSSSQKINSFKMPNNNNRHLNSYLKDRFSVPKHYMGRERCFCCYTWMNKRWCLLRIVSTDTVANTEVCTITNCWHKFSNRDFKFFYSTY